MAKWIEKQKVEGEEIRKKVAEDRRMYLFEQFSDKTDFLEIVREFVKVQPIIYDEGQIWWFWNWRERCWNKKDEIDLLNAIDHTTKFPSVNSSVKYSLLEAFKRVGRSLVPKKLKPTHIQFKDKIYDVLTGESFSSTSSWFATNPIPYSVGENEDTPVMDEIFEQWVGKKNVKTLYEIIAYCCLSDYPIHRLFCLIGEGLNGKSCFLRLLKKFVGEHNCCSTELDTLLSSRFEVTRLHRKLVCMMGETNFNEMSKTSLLKKLTGQDVIGFEYKNKTPFEDLNYAKILIATNNLPTTTDKTLGFYRRWMIIDFPNRFSEEKEILSTIPEEEYECLARKVLFMLNNVLNSRKFTNEGTIEERKERYEAKSNFIEAFMEEHTLEDVDGYITKADFYRKFIGWSKENRHRQMSERSLSLSMKKMGKEDSKMHFGWMFDGKGGQARVWIGIKWR